LNFIVRWSASLAALAAMSAAAAAADYPSRPLKLVVPFAAGGPTDVAGRLIAQALRAPLGESVYVENRGGGGGIVGTELVITDPDYRANLSKHGASVADAPAEQYRALLRSETERWGPIARAAGLKLE